MFILVDDKNRENEGDLIIPASKCNAKSINFMAKHGRGLICLALSKQIDILKLPLMSPINKSRMQTALQFRLKQKKELLRGYQLKIEQRQLKRQLNLMLKKQILFLQVMFSH